MSMNIPVPQPNGWSDPDDKTYPKLPDLAEDVVGGNTYGEAPWHKNVAQTTEAIDENSSQFKEWYEMAKRLQMMREAGHPLNLGTMEELGDPSECECGKPFFITDDYMCPDCRSALDA